MGHGCVEIKLDETAVRYYSTATQLNQSHISLLWKSLIISTIII